MTDSLSGDQVAAWLRQHPEFFQGRPELLEMMRLPDPRGEAVSLLERQAQILRERNGELRERLHSLVAVARENDQLFEKTRRLVLALLEARNPEALIRVLFQHLQEDFGSEAVTLFIYDRRPDLPQDLNARVRCLPQEDLHDAIQALLRSGKTVCGMLRPEEVSQLFPQDAARIHSSAIVPLHDRSAQGLLAIGSQDPDHFRSSLGTLFISHLGDVLARRLADLLRHLPRQEALRA